MSNESNFIRGHQYGIWAKSTDKKIPTRFVLSVDPNNLRPVKVEHCIQKILTVINTCSLKFSDRVRNENLSTPFNHCTVIKFLTITPWIISDASKEICLKPFSICYGMKHKISENKWKKHCCRSKLCYAKLRGCIWECLVWTCS